VAIERRRRSGRHTDANHFHRLAGMGNSFNPRQNASIIRTETAVIKLARFAMALLFLQCLPVAAADQNCMNEYYRSKPAGCVDVILSQLRTATRSKSDPSTVIGFLAQLFVMSPAEKARILDNEPSDYIRSVDLVALHRAGLPDDSRKFADKYRLTALLQKLEASRLAPLSSVIPSSTPADNDLLIGAYMASGDTAFIARILENFSSADDGMVSDAMRLGFMNSKFGPSSTPQGRENVMMPAACEKYQCKTDRAKFLRVLTLASAFWALQSLGRQDEGIKKTFDRFFEDDARLKNLRAGEGAAFGNYLTALAVFAAFKPDQTSGEVDLTSATMSKAASAYETLEPAHKVFDHIEAYVKSGKPAK
jgi:hypothetical protein